MHQRAVRPRLLSPATNAQVEQFVTRRIESIDRQLREIGEPNDAMVSDVESQVNASSSLIRHLLSLGPAPVSDVPVHRDESINEILAVLMGCECHGCHAVFDLESVTFNEHGEEPHCHICEIARRVRLALHNLNPRNPMLVMLLHLFRLCVDLAEYAVRTQME